MTRSQIEYILAVEQLRNFGKAADYCHITQSTLSAMVAKVESQIGVYIFNRKSKPVSVTAEGKKIIAQLKNIHREFLIFDEAVNQIKGIETGNLSIAAIPTVAPYLFPLILGDIAAKFPQVNFTVHELTTSKIVNDIKSGKIDIGIVSTPLNEGELIETHLYNEPFVVYDKRPDHLKSESGITIDSIDSSKLLLLEEGHCLSNQVLKICKLEQVQKLHPSMTYYSGSIESLKRMVDVNEGITLLPAFSVKDASDEELKFIRSFDPPIPSRQIGLVTHKNFIKSNLAKGIISIINEQTQPYIENKELKIIMPF